MNVLNLSSLPVRKRMLLLTMGAPMVAQAIMLIGLLISQQWMFAVMILPSIIGCAASLMMMVSADDASAEPKRSPAERATATRTALPAQSKRTDDFAHIPSTSLESLLALDSLPWRSIVHWWLSRSSSLNVPIGLTNDSRPLYLDICSQGPHALVAGTTGSGKSVFLQTWCLAMAAHVGPDRLNFVFLDFKGGATFRNLEQLPHTIGNVDDLNLDHAARALRALEVELARREHLAATHHATVRALPRLLIVIDEFHALKDQLPDYINRLTRIASLGRSLGMHLIACTQNPLGQVNGTMKANMSLNICLRVRDAMQSHELLGNNRAALISPSMPGAAYCNDAESITALRCANSSPQALCTHIALASEFMGLTQRPPLFTAPLPKTLTYPRHARSGRGLWFGLADDGISIDDARVELEHGNIVIVGALGRGKSTLLDVLTTSALRASVQGIRLTTRTQSGEYVTKSLDTTPLTTWIIDDADALFDPFNTESLAQEVRVALENPSITVIVALASKRHWRHDEYCAASFVFSSGDKSCDLMNGIPASLLTTMSSDAANIPGRAALMSGSKALMTQCAIPPSNFSQFFSQKTLEKRALSCLPR